MTAEKIIYFLEDNMDVSTLVSDALMAAGYRVLQFPSIRAFNSKLVNPLPDLFILDLQLPYSDGAVVTEQLARLSKTPIPPVIVMSSALDKGQCSVENGKRFFMPKPFHMDVLLTTVNRLLS